jgi:hypothetical protein
VAGDIAFPPSITVKLLLPLRRRFPVIGTVND